MASKNQVFRKYTNEEREKITKEYINHKGPLYIFKKYGVSQGTLKTWKRKYQKNGNINPNKKGRQKITNLIEIERLRLENDILKKFQAFQKECMRALLKMSF